MANQTSNTTIPGYTIIRKIGSGGSAVVYLAVQHSLNRRVALKLVKGTLTSEAKFGERFKREGRIIAQLNHPHIIPVYDIGEHEGQYYMAMEYLGGGDLRSQAEQLTLNDLLEVMLQITQALQVAHERGFVHRDIKPANILFRHPKQAVITDFGIARQTESLTQMTVTGTMLGTPAYMSPEQINGNTLDGRADLYSLGITLFEMLTGFQPYRGESIMSVAMQHTGAEIPRLPKASSPLQALIDGLLAKDEDDRINNAEALQSELQELLGLQEKFAAPITSLWPDKAPDIENSAVFTGGGRTRGKKSTKTWQLAATTALGLFLTSGAITWYLTDSSPVGDSDTVVTDQIDSNPPVQIDDAPAPKVSIQQQAPAPWQETLALANELLQKGQLIAPQDNNALALYREVLQQDSGNIIAKNGAQNILQSLVLEVEQHIVNQSLDEAERQLAVLNSLWQDEEQLNRLHNRIVESRNRIEAAKLAAAEAEKQREIDNILQVATAAMIEGRYLKPEKTSARHYFNQVLSLQSNNQSAKLGLRQIADAISVQIQTAISRNNFPLAESLVEDLRQVDPKHAQLQSSTDNIGIAKADFLQQQIEQQHLAELQAEIDQLADRNAQWRLSTEDLDAQSSYGGKLIADITLLLNDHSENSKLRVLFDTTKQRLDEISAQKLQEISAQQDQQPARKPIVGGF